MKSAILAGAILALSTSLGQAQTVRIATEGAFAPFNFVNDAGEIAGFDREVGDELCKRAGLTCTWVTNDWDSIIPNLQSGNYDVIIAAMSITAEREAIIDFTQSYVPPAPSVYAALTADADVKAGVVAAQTGTLHADYVAQTGATLLEFATPDETVAAVRNGEAIAVFADLGFLAPIVAQSNDELTIVGAPVPLGEGFGIGLRSSDVELKAKFDAAIQSMKDDGSLNALILKDIGADAATF